MNPTENRKCSGSCYLIYIAMVTIMSIIRADMASVNPPHSGKICILSQWFLNILPSQAWAAYGVSRAVAELK